MLDVNHIRKDFPALLNSHVAFLDNASTTQKPQKVLEALNEYYQSYCANVHRGVYQWAHRADEAYQQAREQVRAFIHAKALDQVVFAKGATEAINMVASSLSTRWESGEIIVSAMEHHANLVPWQWLAERWGLRIRVIPMACDGSLDLEAYEQLLTSQTRLVAITHVSNVLGTVNPVAQMTRLAKAHGAMVLVDGCQAVSHMPVDVSAIGCDFYVFSGHKLFGPTGIGVLYLQDPQSLVPYQGGGGMIAQVEYEHSTYAPAPYCFEAGTPPIAQAIGLGAAIDYVQSQSWEFILEHERKLLEVLQHALTALPEMKMMPAPADAVSMVALHSTHIHPHDLATILDSKGVCVRAGHHCTMPLHRHWGVPATLRVSLALYNTSHDVHRLVEALQLAVERFSHVG